MLSIIVSSYQSHFFSALETNIARTCVVPYEIIKIENPGLMGICEAYNKGGEKAKYENILFLHEDVIFCDKNWGNQLIQILNLPNCGVVGVAGGLYYSHVPSSWWNSHQKYLHFIQSDKLGNDHFNNRVGFQEQKSLMPAKGLDGVFLACKKKVFEDIRFDENIGGYHGYDLIFSLNAAKKYKNYVTDKILIQHFSNGSLSKDWFDSILKVKRIVGNFPHQKVLRDVEMENYYKLIFSLKKFGYSKKEALTVALKYINPRIHGFSNTAKMLYRIKILLT